MRRDGGRTNAAASTRRSALAEAIDLEVVAAQPVALRKPRPATLIGSGRVRAVGELVARERIDLVVVDAPLSAVQQRNLERAWSCKVIDRTGLILEIFGERARTSEGRLQVELAALTYQRSRLVLVDPSGAPARRLRLPRRPGESQIELDRRRIDDRLTQDPARARCGPPDARPAPRGARAGGLPGDRPGRLHQRRQVDPVQPADRRRGRRPRPAVRDPRPDHARAPPAVRAAAILSDTVGFVADLPTDLIAAFRATLEEVRTADLVLHVRDMAHPERGAAPGRARGAAQPGAGRPGGRGAPARVLEQARPAAGEDRAQLRSAAERQPATVCGSALTGDGIDALLASWTVTPAASRWSSWSSTAPTASASPGCTATAPSWSGATATGART